MSEYFTVVFMGDLKSLEGNPYWYRSEFGVPISIADGHALEALDDLREIPAQGAAPSSADTAAEHHAPEVFLFYRDKQLHHIHTDRKVFEKWMADSAWQYPPDRCEIVRYVPESSSALALAGQTLLKLDRRILDQDAEILRLRDAVPQTEQHPTTPQAGMREALEPTEGMLRAGAQALADDVWHPAQKFESLPKHDQNKFMRNALLVLKAAQVHSGQKRCEEWLSEIRSIVNILDDIEVGADDRCAWGDVANAGEKMRLELKALTPPHCPGEQATKEGEQ
jgi:hypothetical protein